MGAGCFKWRGSTVSGGGGVMIYAVAGCSGWGICSGGVVVDSGGAMGGFVRRQFVTGDYS